MSVSVWWSGKREQDDARSDVIGAIHSTESSSVALDAFVVGEANKGHRVGHNVLDGGFSENRPESWIVEVHGVDLGWNGMIVGSGDDLEWDGVE